MWGEIVHEIKELRLFGLERDMLFENRNQRFGGMVFSASAKDLAGFHLKKGHEVCCSVPGVIMPFETGLTASGRHGRVFPLQGLKVWALVKKEEVIRRVEKERKDSFHLWKEIRVSDLKEVLVAVRR